MSKGGINKKNIKYTTNLENNNISSNSNITSQNISTLKELWKIETSSPVSSDPIVYYRNVYFTDWEGNAYCADKLTGKLLWKIKVYSPPTPLKCKIEKLKLPSIINKKHMQSLTEICPPYSLSGFTGTGVILGDTWYIASIGGKEGPLLENQAPGRLYAINIKTQEIIWNAKLTDYDYGGCLAKLLIYDEIIYAGISGIDESADSFYQSMNLKFDPQTIGGVVAFDCLTGEEIWNKKTVGLLDGDNINAKGASVLCSFALCPKYNMILFGTGNNYGEPASKSSDAIVSLDCKTGEVKWQNQVVKGDAWLGAGPQVFSIRDNMGNIIPAVGIGSKNGYYYTFNRKNGELIWSTKVYTGDDSGPGIRGNAAVANGYIYVWSNNGLNESMTVACLDVNDGKTIWSKIQNSKGAIGAGLLCNDVFLVGDMLGNIVGYNINDGSSIWSIKVENASIASSIIGNDNAIYIGVGIPNTFGGLPKKGVYAYSI